MSRNSIIRWKVAVGVLAVLLVAAVSVLVGTYILAGSSPLAMGGSDSADSGTEWAVDESRQYEEATADMAAGADADGMAPVPQEDQLVRYASLGLRVQDVTGAVEEIRSAARAAGGYIQTSDLYTDGGYPQPLEDGAAAEPTTLTGGYLTVRVVDSALDSFLDAVRGMGDVTAESISSQDVTTQYTDLDARIPILEAERESLTAMLARATTVEEELMIRDRLVAVTAELRSLLDQRAALSDRDTMATVSISLTVPPSALPASSVEIPWFSWYELQQAVAAGVAGFQTIVYGLLTALIATAPLWIPLGIVLAVRRRRRAPVAATAPVTAAPATAPAAAPGGTPAAGPADEDAGTNSQP
jgi:hypothetical protein